MNQMTRTLAFVIAASASVIGAVVAHIATQPPAAGDPAHELIGKEFYPNFTDPTKATAVRVAAWNPNSHKVEQFEVRYENGQWRIPSHNNYPADGREQLAKAAASAVGLVRGSLVSESADTFERMGVVDPLDATAIQGAGSTGTRITLYEGDQVVADYIVGRRPGEDAPATESESTAAAEDSGKQSKSGRFYVRAPDEKLVYLADVNIDVSTRFRDWIKKDLLELSQFDLRKIIVNRYTIDEAQGVRVPGDVSELSRSTSSDPWKLNGLDEEKEKVKTGVVTAMARALDDLQIVGIRKKPAPLVRFFTEGTADILQLIAIQSDLQRHGFFFNPEGQSLWANEGEIVAGTQDGVSYVLRFGEVFTGSDLEVEVGAADGATGDKPTDAAGAPEQPAADAAAATNADSAATPAAAEGSPADAASEPSDAEGKRSRYVLVEALFDPTLLGPEPTPPVKPTPPAATDATPAAPTTEATPPAPTPAAPSADPATTPEAAPPATDDGSNCDDPAPATPPVAADAPAAAAPATPAAPTADAPATPTPEAPAPDAAAPTADGQPVVRPKTPEDVYQEALKQYEQDLEAYEAKQKDYEQRLKDGQKKVDDLNKRFAEWYYVISADLFEDLSVTRAQLVEPVTPPATDAAPAGDAAPAATPSGDAPAGAAPADAAAPAATSPAVPAETPTAAPPENPATPPAESPAPPTAAPPAAEASPSPQTE